MWEESELTVEGIDYDAISLYLGKFLTEKEIEEEGFADLVYIKVKKRTPIKRKKKKASIKKKTGRKHNRKIERRGKPLNDDTDENQETLDISVEREQNETNPDGINDTNDNKNKNILGSKNKEEKFLKPKRKPNLKEKRNLFGKALELMIVVALKNHVYKFENQVRLQTKGGPIGLKLTG